MHRPTGSHTDKQQLYLPSCPLRKVLAVLPRAALTVLCVVAARTMQGAWHLVCLAWLLCESCQHLLELLACLTLAQHFLGEGVLDLHDCSAAGIRAHSAAGWPAWSHQHGDLTHAAFKTAYGH